MEIYNKIKIHKTKEQNGEKHYIIECNKRFYKSTHNLVQLITLLQVCQDHESAILQYIQQTKYKYTTDEIIHVIKNNIDPLVLENEHHKTRNFLFQREIIPSNKLYKISSKLKYLFYYKWMYPFIILSILLDLFFMITLCNKTTTLQTNIYTLLAIFAFTLFSTFIHEIGHASACSFFGIKHGGIGFGLYLNFPLLYTDVTRAWLLNTKKRLIINIAGIYFQLYILDILLILYFFHENDIIFYLILITNLGFIMTLNPFFKFDGYWILSDLTNTPNLQDVSKRLFRSIFKKERKQTFLNNKKKIFLLFYYVFTNAITLFYVLYIIPIFTYSFIKELSGKINMLKLLSQNDNITIEIVTSFTIECCFILFTIFYFVMFFIQILKKNRRKT